MTTLDLRRIPEDTIAIHYGGQIGRVDAYTFANSLVALAEAIQEINAEINPDYKLSVTVDALGRGSFRAKLQMAPKITATLLKKNWSPIVLPLLLTFIYDKLIETDPDIHIEVSHSM